MLDVEAGRNDTRFVDMTILLDDNFAWTMVVDYLEFANVSWMEKKLGQAFTERKRISR